MKILTVGGATRDIFIQYESPELLYLERATGKRAFLILEQGTKIEVQQLKYHSGGGATNSAVSFKRLGFDVTTFFKVGNDKQGEFILCAMEKEGIDTRHIVCATDCATGTSFIIPSLTGDYTVLAYRGANAQLKLDEVPLDEIEHQDQLYITSLSGASSALLLPITQKAKEHEVPVAVNPGGSQLGSGAAMLRESLKNIDILILNAAEANIFMASLVHTDKELQSRIKTADTVAPHGAPLLLQAPIKYGQICFNLSHFFQEVLRRGPRIVVVTNGAEGVYAATKEGIYFHPTIPVKLINSVGAGDAFGSTFVASLLQKKSIEQAMLRGILNSVSVISHMGAKTGLLREQELAGQEATHQLKIQRFSF